MDALLTSYNILLIVLGFSLLILVHELGHLIAAKWAGIRTEAFAVGMGPVVIAWRKGIGVRLGSTHPAVLHRVEDYYKSRGIAVDLTGGDETARRRAMHRAMDQLRIGETEYSLRWLPLGGFVKMLGQEDANPNALSDDPRSYSRRPIGKRMVVVSAGVIMNLLLAALLFIIAFLIGVRLEAPVVGEVAPSMPAGQAIARNAAELGIREPGLKPGDLVTHIDGDPVRTFADIQIASAMAKPGVPVEFTIRREGVIEPLHFAIAPRKDASSGLLGIGIGAGASTTIWHKDENGSVTRALKELGLADHGVKPGMRLESASGQAVQTFQQFQHIVEDSGGQAVQTRWAPVDQHGQTTGPPVEALIEPRPVFQVMRSPGPASERGPASDWGLLGLSPLPRVANLDASPNKDVLRIGDVIVRAGSINGPRVTQVQTEVRKHARGSITLRVLRDGEPLTVTCRVNREGLMNVGLELAYDLPIIAQPMHAVLLPPSDGGPGEIAATPIAPLNLFAMSRILALNDQPIETWHDLWLALRPPTSSPTPASSSTDSTGNPFPGVGGVTMTLRLPTPGAEVQQVSLSLSQRDVQALRELGWQSNLSSDLFEPLQINLTAGGSPLRAIAMGFEETRKLVMMTYLTLDRLVRGSVGVEQLRGPVGIVHIGAKVADRGFMYILFFLGMISVNLAVVNFLPLPIVDGGLFLFLVYEKFKGRPPSLAFQNAATIAGLFLIGTIFLVVTWNDVVRLLS